jgi:hypothetical protein
MNSERQHRADTGGIGVVIVHGVADTEQGANLDTLVKTMRAIPKSGFKVDSYDQIHRLPDDPIDRLPETALVGGRSSGRPVIVRHGSINHRNVAFAEVYWADTTRVNTGKFAALMAAFRIIFEAHYFIDALIDRSANKWRLANVLALLLHAATVLIRGPIAGVNIALLSISAVYLYGQSIMQLADTQGVCKLMVRPIDPKCVIMPLDFAVLLMLCVLVAGSARVFCKSRVAGDVATLEVSVWTTVGIAVAAVVLGIAIVHDWLSPASLPAQRDALQYAKWMFWSVGLFWRAFAILVVCAFFVVLFFVVPTGDSRTRRASWLALALVILQASLWSLFISVPSALLLALGKLAGSLPPEVQQATYGFAFNYMGIILVGIIAGRVMWVRGRAAGNSAANPAEKLSEIKKRQLPLQRIAKSLPRLIMNRGILIAIIAAGLGSVILPFVLLKWHASLGGLFAGRFYASLIVAALVTGLALLLYLLIDSKTSRNFIHIARDLIDHQYRPSRSIVHWLLPVEYRNEPRYPHRERLLHRVKSAVRFLEDKGCHAIVFVAHSQGSIIVFEYLKNLLPAAEGSAHRRAVVTFGAPLDHLYAHYFHDYANVGETLGQLKGSVASWTNLHRIDDPIGNSIRGSDGWMTDIAMGKGGHTKYWEETAVAQVIVESINRLAAARRSEREQVP